MKVTKEQKDFYWDKGWVAVEGVCDPKEMDLLADIVSKQAEEELKVGLHEMYLDRDPDGNIAGARKVNHLFRNHKEFRRLVLESPLPGVIEQLIGYPPLLYGDQAFLKPPLHGKATEYHQDNVYWHFEPADQVITAWVALEDADERNGCMRYINGSHRKILEHTSDAALVPGIWPKGYQMLNWESFAAVKKGGVVFHHGNALHGSGKNNNPDRWRRSYATHWVTANVKAITLPGRPRNVQLDKGYAYFRDPETYRV